MSQSSDTEEDLEMDIAVVHFSRWFKKKEIEHSVDKVIIQKLPFQFANAYLNVRAKKVTKAKAYLEKFENKRREFGVSAVDANEKIIQRNNHNTLGIKGEGMSRPYEPFKNVLLNTKSNDSSSDSRREKCLIRNRPATPPELSHHTKHMGTYSGGHTFVVSDNQLPQFKQAMNETEMTSLGKIRASMMSPKSLLTNYPNLIQENKYSTTAARPIMLLSIKSPSDDKDSKMPVKPLSATNMDFDVKITGNSDEESSEGSSISDDLQGINGVSSELTQTKYVRELKRNQLTLIALSNEFENYCGEIIGFELEHPDEFIAIKNWTNDNWTCHISILAETGIGAELELYAFAAMFSIDVWVFHKKQWLCYRPKFSATNNEKISIRDYRFGEKEGVYLMYEECLFSPVLVPSVQTKTSVL
uniref:Uncharacterized protein n=1 Tax=Wuchereria bancrofti TaxID=6293 RepID=A0A1I8EEG0_WUCBA